MYSVKSVQMGLSPARSPTQTGASLIQSESGSFVNTLSVIISDVNLFNSFHLTRQM